MKQRLGFVSNSSSSSFICDVCGKDATGWDMCLYEAEMFECENGHIFCESHAKDKITSLEVIREFIFSEEKKIKEGKESYYKDSIDDYYVIMNNEDLSEDEKNEKIEEEFADWGLDADGRYSVPAKYCPICSLELFQDVDMKNYLIKKVGINEDEIKKEIQEKYSDYKEFVNDIKK